MLARAGMPPSRRHPSDALTGFILLGLARLTKNRPSCLCVRRACALFQRTIERQAHSPPHIGWKHSPSSSTRASRLLAIGASRPSRQDANRAENKAAFAAFWCQESHCHVCLGRTSYMRNNEVVLAQRRCAQKTRLRWLAGLSAIHVGRGLFQGEVVDGRTPQAALRPDVSSKVDQQSLHVREAHTP